MNKGLYVSENQFMSFAELENIRYKREIATRANTPYGFANIFGYLPDPDTVLKKMGKDLSVYRDLLVDSKVIAVTEQRKGQTLSMEWEIDRGKSKSREAKIIEDYFNDLDVDGLLSQAIDATWYGMIPFEIIPKRIGNLLLPFPVAKPPEWFAFDDENKLLFKSKSKPLGELVPENKFILARHKNDYLNPYGFRLASACFWPVTFKKGGMKFWLKFAEKYGIPWVVGKQPRGTGQAQTDEFADSLADMVQDAVLVVPDDNSVDVLESKGTGTSVHKELKEACNDEIALAVLTETLTTEMGNVGSRAASETHSDKSMSVTQGTDVKIGEKFFNDLIKWIHKYNFSSSNRSIFTLYQEEDVDQALAKRDESLTKQGVKLSRKYYLKSYNLDEEDIEEEPEIDENKQTAQAQNLPYQQPGISPKPGQEGPVTAEHSENEPPPAMDEETVSAAAENLPADLLQKQIEKTLKPVFDLIEHSESYDEIINGLAELFPDMETKQQEYLLTKAMFLSEIMGRLAIDKETN